MDTARRLAQGAVELVRGRPVARNLHFRNAEQDKNGVKVKVRRLGKDLYLTAKKLIAADGLCSRVAKVTGAKPKEYFEVTNAASREASRGG